ncbi:MAG: hypothetical protein IIU19_01610 [Oscillospiraceae bacterium]|nr:hypothetical protein [Oscillospiraceae bacterium]
MKLFFRILKIVFSVLGSLLVILLLFPVRLDILWKDTVFTADLRYIFFRRRLSPKDKKGKDEETHGEEKEETDDGSAGTGSHSAQTASETGPVHDSAPVSQMEEKAPEQIKQEKENKKTEKEEDSLSGTIEKIKRIVAPLLKPGYWLFRMLLRAVHVRDVSVVVNVTGSDPASVGFRSGIQWSLIGNFMNTLNYLFGKNVTYGDVTVYPCFGDAEPKEEKMSCTVSVRPLIVILLVLGFLLGYLFELVRNLLKRGGKKNVK